MTMLMHCRTCGHEMQVEQPTDSVLKCPSCGQVIEVASAPAAGNLSPVGPDPSPAAQRTPAEADDLIPCPDCGERNRKDASFCHSCRRDLNEGVPPWERSGHGGLRRDVEPHRGNLILVLGILGFGLPLVGLALAIAAWVMGRRDLARMDKGTLDPQGKGITQAGFVCGIIATVLQALLLLFCVGYIVLVILVLSAFFQSMPPRPPVKLAPPRPPPAPGKVFQVRGTALRLADYLPRR
jgi:predicted RNA-binding Zn-ribbon protein involved in translation (DUF1610 family)